MQSIHVFRKILQMSSHNVPPVRPMETRYVLCQIQQTESLEHTSTKDRRIRQVVIFIPHPSSPSFHFFIPFMPLTRFLLSLFS
jgi:hypothetical protein